MLPLITDTAIEAIAAGIFAKPEPFVVQAYSEPDHEPLQFWSQQDLAVYMKAQVAQPRGLAYVFVVYPDMGGRAVCRTIHLDPKYSQGQELRYTWDGWGLISVQLYGPEQAVRSRIASNSEARAKAWASTQPDWEAPSRWHWPAVGSHTRRLQRLLRQVTGKANDQQA